MDGKVWTTSYDATEYRSRETGQKRRPSTNEDERTGQSQFLTSPMLAKPLQFKDLTLDDPNYDEDLTSPRGPIDSDSRLMEMLAAQAAHQVGPSFTDVDTIADDDKIPEEEKKDMIQKAMHMAASNGDVESVRRILGGKARPFVDINGPDEDGTTPLIYASCFVGCPIPMHSGFAGVVFGTNNIYANASRYRAMRAWCKRSSTAASTSTSKTGISGAP